MSSGDGMDSTLEYILSDTRGFLLYVLLCQAPKTAVSQGPERAMFICYGEPLGMFDRGPKSLPWVIERGGRGRHVVKFCLSR
jgi:hypothetical protein